MSYYEPRMILDPKAKEIKVLMPVEYTKKHWWSDPILKLEEVGRIKLIKPVDKKKKAL